MVSELVGEPFRKDLLKLTDTLAKIQEPLITTVRGPLSAPRFLMLGGLAILFGGNSMGMAPGVSQVVGTSILVSPMALTRFWTSPGGIKLLTDGFELGLTGRASAQYYGRVMGHLTKYGIDHQILSPNKALDVLIESNKRNQEAPE